MILGTAEQDGTPWVSPIWFAADAYREFLWISSLDARHSRNIAARAQVSIVVFDSHVRAGVGQGVYMTATAHQLSELELKHGLAVFTRRERAHGIPESTLEDVSGRARLRLYRAVVAQHWILDPTGRDGGPGRVRDLRVPVEPASPG